MENECEALPGVAYPGVRDNRSTINTKTGYDDDDWGLYSHIFAPINVKVGMGERTRVCSRLSGQRVAAARRKTHFWASE